MKKIKVILYFLFTICVWDSAVGQVTKFEKIYGASGYDYGYSVTQVYDKGYVVAGATTSKGLGSTDAYLLKVDSIGTVKWDKTFGGINIDQLYSIKTTNDSGLVVAGFTNSLGHGGYDMYVIRTNKLGDSLWTKTYGGADWDFAYSIEKTNDGGYILAGGTYSYGKGDEDMYLVKINANGDTLWTKMYGGINEDEAWKAKQTNDGGYLIVGTTKSFGDVNGDMYIIKTNSMGDTLWTTRYGGTDIDEAYDIIEKDDGQIIVCGRTNSMGSGNFDGVVVYLSSTGTYIHHDLYGGTDDDGFYSMNLAANGRFAVSGYTYSYGFTLGTADFVLYIQNPFNGFHSANLGGNKMEKAYCINPTEDNGYILCGNSTSYSNLDHIYLVKLDSNGISSANVINIPTGIAENKNIIPNTYLYPNPADKSCTLVLPLSENYTITLVDIFGRQYYQDVVYNNNKSNYIIPTHNLNNGFYIVKIDGETTQLSQRILIQH